MYFSFFNHFIILLLPPLGVCFCHGCWSVCLHFLLSPHIYLIMNVYFLQVEFIIYLLLTILGYIPGIIYALYAIIFVDRDQYFDEYRRPLCAQY
ncbi:hypothetical protein AHAS_Ahas16G0005900 [Arachis hypogaea]